QRPHASCLGGRCIGASCSGGGCFIMVGTTICRCAGGAAWAASSIIVDCEDNGCPCRGGAAACASSRNSVFCFLSSAIVGCGPASYRVRPRLTRGSTKGYVLAFKTVPRREGGSEN